MREIWIYPKGSNTVFQGTFPEDWKNRLEEYQPIYDKRGLLKTITFREDTGQLITIECISKSTFKQRAAVWVFPKGTASIYQDTFPEDWETRIEEYCPTFNKKGLLETLTLPNGKGQMITIECITRIALSKRADAVWVSPKNSDTVYQGSFPKDWQTRVDDYSPTYNKVGLLDTLTFPDGEGQMVTVQRITKQVLYQRSAVWVCPKGSSSIFKGHFPEDWETRLEDYKPTYHKKGYVETLTFPDGKGQMVTVECIGKQALIRRAAVWVCPKGSNTIYQGTFPEDWENKIEEYQPTYNKNGLLETLTFQCDNGQITVECITKQLFNRRSAVWVYPQGSDTIYQGPFPEDWEARLEEYQPTYTKNTYTKNGLLDTLTLPGSKGQVVTVQRITKQLLYQRSAVWVCPKGSATIYQGPFPDDWESRLENYQPTHHKKGYLETLTFPDSTGQIITIECITKQTLHRRASIWVYPMDSDYLYTASLPEDWQTQLEKYHPTYNKKGLLKSLTVPNETQQMIPIEYISQNTLTKRQSNQAASSPKAQISRKRKAAPLTHPQPKKQKFAIEPIDENNFDLQVAPENVLPAMNPLIVPKRYHFFTSKNRNESTQSSQLEKELLDFFDMDLS